MVKCFLKRAGRAGAAICSVAAAGTAGADCSIGKVLELPVTMSGMAPLVSAQLDGRPAQLVVDSSSFFSSMSPNAAADLNLRLGPASTGLSFRGVAGDKEARLATVERFGLGATTLPRVQFLIGGSDVSAVAAGSLGQNLLGLSDIEYDFARGVLRFLKPVGCGNANLAYWAHGQAVSELPIESLEASHYHTVGMVTLNGVRLRARFGSASRTLVSLAAAARAGVRPDSPGVTSAGMNFGSTTSPTWIGSFASLKIGDEEIRNVRLRFGGSVTSNIDTADLTIGTDFFLSHRIYVANSAHKLFFTYSGGPVFNVAIRSVTTNQPTSAVPAMSTTATRPESAVEPPSSAADLDREGQSWAARRDFTHALADLARAVDLAPQEFAYRYHYALALFGGGRREAGVAELDRALALKPDEPNALLVRAGVRLRDDHDGARADVDAASKVIPASSELRLDLAALYRELDAFDLAIGEYDRWVAIHPDDDRLPSALNGRCWTRALAGRDLAAARNDCDRAIKLRPHVASFLDSRGLVRLRAGDSEGALKDYNAALAANPKTAWSLYGRGIAKLKLGDKAGSDADLAAAAAIAPRLAENARRYGVQP